MLILHLADYVGLKLGTMMQLVYPLNCSLPLLSVGNQDVSIDEGGNQNVSSDEGW